MSQQEIEEALDRGLLEVNIREGKWWKVRRNGKTQTWKTRPNDYRIPAKTGFRTTFQITPDKIHLLRIVEPITA